MRTRHRLPSAQKVTAPLRAETTEQGQIGVHWGDKFVLRFWWNIPDGCPACKGRSGESAGVGCGEQAWLLGGPTQVSEGHFPPALVCWGPSRWAPLLGILLQTEARAPTWILPSVLLPSLLDSRGPSSHSAGRTAVWRGLRETSWAQWSCVPAQLRGGQGRSSAACLEEDGLGEPPVSSPHVGMVTNPRGFGTTTNVYGTDRGGRRGSSGKALNGTKFMRKGTEGQPWEARGNAALRSRSHPPGKKESSHKREGSCGF